MSSSKKNFLPISVATLQLYGGLNQIILPHRLLFLFCVSTNTLRWNSIFCLLPLFFRALLKQSFVLLRTCSSGYSLFIRFDILSGRFLVMCLDYNVGGLLELTSIRDYCLVYYKADIFPLKGWQFWKIDNFGNLHTLYVTNMYIYVCIYTC